jgi:hypothetical protein
MRFCTLLIIDPRTVTPTEPWPLRPLVYLLLFLIAVAWNLGITRLIGHQRWLDRRAPRRPR